MTRADSTRPHRDHAVDRLRGFALFGVLIVNAPFLLTSLGGMNAASMPTPLDVVAGFVTSALFQAKSYVVFAFLFGYSLELWRRETMSRGLPFARLHVQRHIGLIALGVLNGTALFVGDILVLYGSLGLLSWPLLRCRDRTLLRAAGASYALQAVLLLAATALASSAVPGTESQASEVASLDRAIASAGILEGLVLRARIWPHALALVVGLQGALVAACFGVGVVAARNSWLRAPESAAPRWRVIRRVGLAAGLPPQLVAAAIDVAPAVSERAQLAALALQYLTAPALSAGLVALIATLPRRGVVRWAEVSGRSSLSTYLCGSLALSVLAARPGFGLFGLDTGPTFLVALTTASTLLAIGVAFGRRFGTGPAERLLRAATYLGVTRHGR